MKPLKLGTLPLLIASATASSMLSRAQQPSAPLPAVSSTVTVVGSPEPVTLGESNRSTVVLETTEHPLAVPQVEDYLRGDASTFVAQRGAGGSQADISVRGTSFEQTLVLLNGLRINDAETSHNNMDIPISLSAMRSIDVLHGAGSTLYGSDAIGGTVDFVTAEPKRYSMRLRAGGGNFGTSQQEAVLTGAGKRWSEMLAGGRDFSSGFMVDRDYRDEELSSETRFKTFLGTTDVLIAGDDRAFGANQFYGNYPSYERTKGWFASINQALGPQTQTAFGYRRHTDEYVLFRNNPSLYENNHIDTSWEAVLRRSDSVGRHLKLSYGTEADGDSIHSNNLGIHARNWGAGYLDAEFQWSRTTLSAGLREEIISGGYHVTSPMLAGSLHVSSKVKLRSAAGYGFRLPTYLDLYYSDPTTIGNPNLKPESAWNFEAGADWYANAHIFFSSTGFYSRQRYAIDYVRTDASDLWHATNLSGLRFAGWENAAVWQPSHSSQLRASWTLLAGAQQALHGLQSEYVFNYPINNASIELTHVWNAAYMIHTRIGVTERYQQDPYAVWDLSLARERGSIHPYLRLSNVTNTGYQEILNVQMPGRTVVAGMEITWSRHDR
jgi:outer membrane receptor protein involved in Fe transport